MLTLGRCDHFHADLAQMLVWWHMSANHRNFNVFGYELFVLLVNISGLLLGDLAISVRIPGFWTPVCQTQSFIWQEIFQAKLVQIWPFLSNFLTASCLYNHLPLIVGYL